MRICSSENKKIIIMHPYIRTVNNDAVEFYSFRRPFSSIISNRVANMFIIAKGLLDKIKGHHNFERFSSLNI